MRILNIRRLAAAISVLLLLAGPSCKKFMNPSLQDQPTPASDPNLATKLVTGVYNGLLTGDTWGTGNDVHGFSFIGTTSIMSDDADKGSTADDQPGIGEFDNFTHTSSNYFCNAMWNGYYYVIGSANYALEAIPQATTLDSTTKRTYAGEMRFIRAYLYFNLVRFFGDVPMVTRRPNDAKDANSDPAFTLRVSKDVIYDSLIIPDLIFAINNTPLKNMAVLGHANKGAAQSLLAKVYMYRKNWQGAYDLTNDVINSAQYSLDPSYANLWRPSGNNGVESIFEIQSGVFANTDLGITLYSESQGPRVGGKGGWTDLGWGFCIPTKSLINAYEAGDVRKDASIITVDQSGKHVGTYLWDGFRLPSSDSVQDLYYNYKAYNSELKSANPIYTGNRDNRQKNIHLLRYADVLLIHAEAANELGKISEATTNLNLVRSRAQLASTTATGQSDLRTAIWKERRVELAFEHDRFWDLVRTGQVAAAMQAAGKTNFVAGKNELLPIPSVQIALSNGKLTQNPGY